jgi:hypothetical protein
MVDGIVNLPPVLVLVKGGGVELLVGFVDDGEVEFCVSVVEGLSVGLVDSIVFLLLVLMILEVELPTDGNNVLFGEGLIKGVAM